MPNQQIVTTGNINFSADSKLPGQDSKNIGNFSVDISDVTAAASDPKSFVLQPNTSVTVAFIETATKYFAVKADIPLTIKFGGAIGPMPVAPFFALGGDVVALGACVLHNPDTANAANVELFSVGA